MPETDNNRRIRQSFDRRIVIESTIVGYALHRIRLIDRQTTEHRFRSKWITVNHVLLDINIIFRVIFPALRQP